MSKRRFSRHAALVASIRRDLNRSTDMPNGMSIRIAILQTEAFYHGYCEAMNWDADSKLIAYISSLLELL
jgi:hypothetical protein